VTAPLLLERDKTKAQQRASTLVRDRLCHAAFTSTERVAMSSDLRKRQTKKDEVIRQKMEKDLAKKRPTAARQRTSSRKAAPGSVSSLKPTPPMTVPADMTVHEGMRLWDVNVC
jgi:hypothetical protein